MFSTMELFCQVCGKKFETDFMAYHARSCSRECYREFEWRKTLSIMGKDYYPDPRLTEGKESDNA